VIAGVQPLGERDGRVSLFLAEDLWALFSPTAPPPGQEIHERLRDHLARHGASFFAELHEASAEALPGPALAALWDLFFAGQVTNDTPGALRAFLGSRTTRVAERRRRLGRAYRSRRAMSPGAGGRWSLLVPPRGAKAPTPTARAAAIATQLVSRHGVLTRDALVAEDVPGGFAALYPVLRALEEAGKLRRGYFVEGRGGSQFADPGALERLRALRSSADSGDAGPLPGVVLASTDPANPYGAALPWPAAGQALRPMRAAGTHVALVAGRLAGYLGRDERELATFLPAEEPDRSRLARGLCAALARWASRTGRSLLGWDRADGEPLFASALAPFLVEAGFERSGPGFRLARLPD
jgi:ATP-dependent Lhr-like helicase